MAFQWLIEKQLLKSRSDLKNSRGQGQLLGSQSGVGVDKRPSIHCYSTSNKAEKRPRLYSASNALRDSNSSLVGNSNKKETTDLHELQHAQYLELIRLLKEEQ